MAVAIGLMPALSLEKPQDLSEFTLCPISELGSYDLNEADSGAYQALARAYAESRGASEKYQVVLIQRTGNQPQDVRIAESRAAVDCLAFAAVCGGRKHMLENPGWAVLAFPDYFHLSPIVAGKSGGFISDTSRILVYSTDTQDMALFWPVERALDPRNIRWDHNLMIALSGVVVRLLQSSIDVEATRIARSLSLMNQALRGLSDLIPGHVDVAEPFVLAVSALETLCHPGTGDASRSTVLHQTKALSFASSVFSNLTNSNRKKRVVALIDQVYQVRHSYIHGDKIEPSKLCYDENPDSTDLLRPLLFLYRKLIIAKAHSMGHISFVGPPDRSTDNLTVDEGVEWFRLHKQASDHRSLEEECDGLLGRLLTEKAWWPNW